LALTCAFVIAPSENAVDAERKTAAYLMFASVVAKKIANPATNSGPVSAMRVCREFIRQLNVVMMTVQAAPIMYGGTVRSCFCEVVCPGFIVLMIVGK
jgi:hypothetical protein